MAGGIKRFWDSFFNQDMGNYGVVGSTSKAPGLTQPVAPPAPVVTTTGSRSITASGTQEMGAGKPGVAYTVPPVAPIRPVAAPNGGIGTLPNPSPKPNPGLLNANQPGYSVPGTGDGYAMLINPINGDKVRVPINSAEANKYLNAQGDNQFYLMGADGRPVYAPQRGENNYNFRPKSAPTAKDIENAYENPAETPKLFGRMFEGVTDAQSNVTDVRKAQDTNINDLSEARLAEGLTQAQAEMNAINQEVASYNATVQNIENDVRNDLPGASESFIQAEVQRRSHDLQAQGNRLIQQQNFAQAKLQLTVDRTSERFNAVRADAAEQVNIAAQQLGFAVENINSATTLFANMKQFELLNDQQASAKRDAARATASLLITNPIAMKNMTSQQLATVESEAGFPSGTLQEIRDAGISMGTPVAQAMKGGDLNMLFFDPKTNTYQMKTFPNFGDVATSSASVSGQKLYSNMSPADRAIFDRGGEILKQIAEAPSTGPVVIKIGGETHQFRDRTSAYTALGSDMQAAGFKSSAPDAFIDFYDKVWTPFAMQASGIPSDWAQAYGRSVGESDANIEGATDAANNLGGR